MTKKTLFLFFILFSGFIVKATTNYTSVNYGMGNVSIRIISPSYPRYPDGAPIIISTPTFFINQLGYQSDILSDTAFGFIHISYLWPGKNDMTSGTASTGIYDYGGPIGMTAFKEVIRFALGIKTNLNGQTITQLGLVDASGQPLIPLTNNVGLFAFSHPGIAATNVLAYFGNSINGVKYFVGKENPTYDALACLEAGHFDGVTPKPNPYYTYPDDYTSTHLNIDYSAVGWLVDSNFPDGIPYFGTPSTFTMNTQIPKMINDSLRFYSVELLQALISNNALDTNNWPPNLCTLEQAKTMWPYRSVVGSDFNNYDTIGTKIPDLKVMLIYCQKEHVQPASDKPGLHQAYDGFRGAANLSWVRINPDFSYVQYRNASFNTGSFPDNDANTAPSMSDWATIDSAINPQTSRPWCYQHAGGTTFYQMPEAGVIEMADRVHENNWDANLNSILPITSSIQEEHPGYDPVITVFPNPVKGVIISTFNCKYNSRASLTLYDLKGRKVSDLWKGRATEGINTIKVESPDVAKGIYYIKFIIGDNASFKKIVLM